MGEATWILRINIFVSVFLVIRPSEFPSFFDDDDLKDLGVKGHKSQYNPPTATGRSTDHGPGYVPAPRNDENSAIIPPNGLPVPYKPPQMFKKKPFNPYGRSDPKDQNIIQQMEEEEGEAIFPEDDGKAFGGDDFTDLDQLPKRLTDAGKWDEFRKLVAMEGWEDDAHMWAGYSKHLLQRSAHQEEKKAIVSLIQKYLFPIK
ncbi:hypothetical protein B5X24_HaOG211102 [Helicoverpa armigera]|uniref:Uncharacterized protein n=1 Tax=Helicoverpa armigera TaxID=29058 RepID=A0A2W1BFH8_HELAM|nr:hypothetical protein B5X24_HaOG211102 [Helicoverpa armigera]